MNAQLLPSLKQFVSTQPYLYRKLCFWARRRGSNHLAVEVNQYLTELVLEPDAQDDPATLLKRWSKVLSPQERIALAQLSPILIRDYPGGSGWYALQKGEYSVMDEPVLHEICHQGEQQAIITRNRYDCLILNARNLLIVDVDIGGVDPAVDSDCAASCRIAISVRQALAALDAIVQQFPHLGFRVYRTRNGLRYFCTTRPFDPLSRTTHRLMQNLYVDPLYARLCNFQATFRARLTLKPWRVEMAEETGRFTYDRATGLVLPEQTAYAVCHLLKIVGQQVILPQFESAIQVHDSFCRVEQLNLDLA